VKINSQEKAASTTQSQQEVKLTSIFALNKTPSIEVGSSAKQLVFVW